MSTISTISSQPTAIPTFTVQEKEKFKAVVNSKNGKIIADILLSNGFKGQVTLRGSKKETTLLITGPMTIDLSKDEKRIQTMVNDKIKRLELISEKFKEISKLWASSKKHFTLNVERFTELTQSAKKLEMHNIIDKSTSTLIQDMTEFCTHATLFLEDQEKGKQLTAPLSTSATKTPQTDGLIKEVDNALKKLEATMKQTEKILVTSNKATEEAPSAKKSEQMQIIRREKLKYIQSLAKIKNSLRIFSEKANHINGKGRMTFDVSHHRYGTFPIAIGKFPTKDIVEVRHLLNLTYQAYEECNVFLEKSLGFINFMTE